MVAGKKPTPESLLALLLGKAPKLAKLKEIAAQEAKSLRRRSTYAPVPGKEHCPVCWTHRKATNQLRAEPHHNAVGVFALVCDACGFYLVF